MKPVGVASRCPLCGMYDAGDWEVVVVEEVEEVEEEEEEGQTHSLTHTHTHTHINTGLRSCKARR